MFLAPVTLTLTNHLHIQTWPVLPKDKRDAQIWTSYVTASYIKALESYRPTQVTRGHFRSSDKDGSHTIWSTVVENHMLHANLMALSITELESWVIEVYIAGKGILDVFGSCDLVLEPMTFIYELDPYYTEIYQMCKYELRMSRLSKVIAWQTYIQRDGQNRLKLQSMLLCGCSVICDKLRNGTR